jgi:hypothetical protein
LPSLPILGGGSGGGTGGGGGGGLIPGLPLPWPIGSGSGGSGGTGGGGGGGLIPGLPLPWPIGSGSGGSGGTGGLTGGNGSGGSTTPVMVTPDGTTVPIRTASGGLLSPAAAFVPSALIMGFAGAGPDLATLADSLSSPTLASMPDAQVQAPLLAAAESGNTSAGGVIAQAFGRNAVPGLVVILATAVLAAVGSAHYRVWQARRAGTATAGAGRP